MAIQNKYVRVFQVLVLLGSICIFQRVTGYTNEITVAESAGITNAGWEEVSPGSATGGGISDSLTRSSYPSMAYAPDGTMYIAWQEYDGHDYEIYVKKWTGTAWEAVGVGSASGGGISNNDTVSLRPTLAIAPDGTLYVAWEDDGDSWTYNIYVKRWNGINWSEVGYGSASGSGISRNTGFSWYPSIAVSSDGTPFIAWADNSYYCGSGWQIHVLYWTGSMWNGAGYYYSGYCCGIAGGSRPSLENSDDGDIYAVWHDWVDGNASSEVYGARFDGDSWSEIGAGSATNGGISNTPLHSQRAVLALGPDETIYVAWWQETGYDQYEIYGKHFDGESWGEIGVGSASGGGISDNTGASNLPTIATTSNGTLYVAWADNTDGDNEIYLLRWSDGVWEEADTGSAVAGGISNNQGDSAYPSLAISPNEIPYIAWDDDSNGNEEIYVRFLDILPPPQITIQYIEVTQGIQTEDFKVHLIEGKRTFVRVYVDSGPDWVSVPQVSGVLHGYGPDGEFADSPLDPDNDNVVAYHEPWQDQRGELAKTLNFKLPESWCTGAITLTAEVDGFRLSENLPFEAARVPNIIRVPVRVGDLVPTDSIEQAYYLAQTVWPTAEVNYVWHPEVTWHPNQACLRLTRLSDRQRCLADDLLTMLDDLYRDQNVGGKIFGWLHEDVLETLPLPLGSSDPTWREDRKGYGKAAFGVEQYTSDTLGISRTIEAPSTFVHEIGHLYDRRHTNTADNVNHEDECGLRDLEQNPVPPNWEGTEDQWRAYVDLKSDWIRDDGIPESPPPFEDSRIQTYGLYPSHFVWFLATNSSLRDPSKVYDFMSYCGSHSARTIWTSPWTFNRLYNEIFKLSTPSSLQSYTVEPPMLNVNGFIFSDDTALINPIWTITPTTAIEFPLEGSEYCVEVLDNSSILLNNRCFDVTFVDYETGIDTNVVGFHEMLRYNPDASSVVVKKGGTVLTEVVASGYMPTVSVTWPNGGESLGATGEYTVTWSAQDQDGDQLFYRVQYSPDGNNWTSLGVGITTTHLLINAEHLAGSNSAWVRVYVTDGFYTSSDESDNAFSVGVKGPNAYILAPEEDGQVPENTLVWFEGYANDLEDGLLKGDALQWSSSIDGILGGGTEILTLLSPGMHTIALTATDSDGMSGTDTLQVLVEDIHFFVYLPLVLRN